MADRHADLADLALGQHVVRIVAGLGRQIEGDGEAGLSLGQVLAIKLVGGRGGGMARVGPENPRLVALGFVAHRLRLRVAAIRLSALLQCNISSASYSLGCAKTPARSATTAALRLTNFILRFALPNNRPWHSSTGPYAVRFERVLGGDGSLNVQARRAIGIARFNLRIGTKLAITVGAGVVLVVAMILNQQFGNSSVARQAERGRSDQAVATDLLHAGVALQRMQIGTREIRLAISEREAERGARRAAQGRRNKAVSYPAGGLRELRQRGEPRAAGKGHRLGQGL